MTHKRKARITEALTRLQRDNWDDLELCLAIIDDFVNWASAQSKFITGAWSRAITSSTQLQHMGETGNEYGSIFADKLMTRMREAADMSLLILSHLMTCDGVNWYGSLPDSGGEGQLSGKESADDLIGPLLEQFREFLGADATVGDDTWKAHICGSGFPEGTQTYVYWQSREVDAMPREEGKGEDEPPVPFRPWFHLSRPWRGYLGTYPAVRLPSSDCSR
jgi:hypothetical protein